nr:reverse transcriptase domain-containing protein [Tanacetum cinerariifolium]
DTFYNALNPNDQDALDSAAGRNFLDKIPRECLSIIESKSKVRYSRSRVTNFPPIDRSDFTHEEFADELAHIISPPEYDCFYFRNLLDPGEYIPILDSGIRENLSTTRVNLPVEDDHSPLLAYVVWIFFAYLTYPVIPPYLHSFGNEDTIFDPCIAINRFYSFKPGLSHRYGTFKKFNTHRSYLNESPMEMLFSTCFPMDQ